MSISSLIRNNGSLCRRSAVTLNAHKSILSSFKSDQRQGEDVYIFTKVHLKHLIMSMRYVLLAGRLIPLSLSLSLQLVKASDSKPLTPSNSFQIFAFLRFSAAFHGFPQLTARLCSLMLKICSDL